MQLPPRILVREAPLDGRPLRVAAPFIGVDFPAEGGDIRDTAIQALALQDAQFDFGHIEPTAVFGRVVKLQLSENPSGLFRGEGFIE